MLPNNQRPNESKKRSIQPEYEEVDLQPTIQSSAFLKRQKVLEPVAINIEENKEVYDLCSESEEEDNMSP